MKTLHIIQPEKNNQHSLGRAVTDNGQQSLVHSLLRYFAPRVFFSLLFFILSVVFAQAQQVNLNTNSRILLRQAMLDIDRLDYDKAISKLLDFRSQNDENANVNYLLGTCYLYSSSRIRSIEKAAFYLSLASKKINTEYESWDLSESAAPSEVLYHLGKAEEKLGNYQLAAEAFEDFLTVLSEDKNIKRSKMYGLIEKTAMEYQLAADKQGNLTTEKTNLALQKK